MYRLFSANSYIFRVSGDTESSQLKPEFNLYMHPINECLRNGKDAVLVEQWLGLPKTD